MKRAQILLVCFLAGVVTVNSQISQQDVISNIQQITVFYQGAQIQRTTKPVSVEKGQTILKIKGLEEIIL